MSKYERWLIYPALIILLFWCALQQVQLYIHRQALASFKVSIRLRTEIIELNGKRLELLEELLVMQSFSSFQGR